MTLILAIALLILSVVCAVCIFANELWKGFEEFAAAKLAEDSWQDVPHGDCPNVPDACRSHARRNTQ